MVQIHQNQPQAKPGVVYAQLYLVPNIEGLTWGPRTTAVLQNMLAKYFNVQWAGIIHSNSIDEMVVYCGTALDDCTEVKFPADTNFVGWAGWIHVSDQDEERAGTVFQRILWALHEEIDRCKALAAEVQQKAAAESI